MKNILLLFAMLISSSSSAQQILLEYKLGADMGEFYFTNAVGKDGKADLFGGTLGELSLSVEMNQKYWLRSTIARTQIYAFLGEEVLSKKEKDIERRRNYSIGTFHHLEITPELRFWEQRLYVNVGLGLGYINEREKKQHRRKYSFFGCLGTICSSERWLKNS